MRAFVLLFLSLVLLNINPKQAKATNGPAALWVAGASSTPTHWNVEIGVLINAEIRGVELSPLPDELTVWIKSSHSGNTELIANRIPGTSNYSFSYTPPVFSQDQHHACGTSIVSYDQEGHNTTNDLIDDGQLNGSSSAACGLRYTYRGTPTDCMVPVSTEASTWSLIKAQRYQ